MFKINLKLIQVIISVFIYLFLLVGSGYGFFTCINDVGGILPSDQDLAFFGVGFCSVPFIFLFFGIFSFAYSVYKEFISLSVKDKNIADSAESGSGKNQP